MDNPEFSRAGDVASLVDPALPWVGLIVIASLLVTGAVAIVREIRIENEESRAENAADEGLL